MALFLALFSCTDSEQPSSDTWRQPSAQLWSSAHLGSSFLSNTLATWCQQPTHWKRPWCWERLKAKGEEGDRGWNGWIASPIQRTWTWANSRRWWGTGRPGVLKSSGSQRVRHDLATEQFLSSIVSRYLQSCLASLNSPLSSIQTQLGSTWAPPPGTDSGCCLLTVLSDSLWPHSQ